MKMQKRKVAIIGAGVAGMTSAIELMDSCQVHLYEATSSLGGRATILKHSISDEFIDNGQHICVGAYKHFLAFLEKIGSVDNFHILEKYNIPYFYNGKFYRLQSKYLKGKFGLLEAILRDKNFSLNEKINNISFAVKLQLDSISVQNFENCYELLIHHNISEKAIRILWEPLIVSTMNISIQLASPVIFENIMLDAFLSKSENATFLIPKVHFGELFKNFESVFVNDSNKIKYNKPVKNIQLIEGKYCIDNDEYYDDVIVTTLSFVTKRMLADIPIDIFVPEYSPILSIYIWLDRKLNDDIMVSAVDTCFDWLFNRDLTLDRKSNDYSYQLTVSDAVRFNKMKDENIMTELEADLRKMYDIGFHINDYKIVRELMATFKADKENNVQRPVIQTEIKGLYLAGDYSRNGYPSTLEGAAKNGFIAAQHILKYT